MKNYLKPDRLHIQKNKKFFCGIFVCITLAVVACWIGSTMYSTAKTEEKKVDVEEQARLFEMSNYLLEIDEIVTSNGEHLSQASLNNNETEKNLTDIFQKLIVLDKNLASVTTKLSELMQRQDTRLSTTLNTVNNTLMEYQNEIKLQMQAITDILAEIKLDNAENYNNTISKMLTLQKTLNSIEGSLKNYHNESIDAIKMLKIEMQENDADLIKELGDIENEIEALVKNELDDLKLQLDENVFTLLQKLQSLHEQILDAKESVANLIKLSDINAADRQEEVQFAFAFTNRLIEQIATNFGAAHQEIQLVIAELKATESANHKETLDVLSKMEIDMSESSIESLNKITESLKTLQDSMKDELSQNFSDLTGNVTNHFDVLGGDMTQQHQQVVEAIQSSTTSLQKEILATLSEDNVLLKEYLLTLFGDSDSALKEYIVNTLKKQDSELQEYIANALNSQNSDLQIYLTSEFDTLNQQLEQLFMSVSSGKQGLASALTDKGVDTDAAAKFDVMATNVRKIGERADVVSSSLLNGFTAYVDNEYIVGSMANHSSVNLLLNCGQSYAIPSGYHNGNGKITANTLESQTPATAVAANLSKAVTGWVNGILVTGTGADNDAAYNQGYADGTKDALSGVGITYTYHVHSGDSTGNGCYTMPIYHVHLGECYISVRCGCSGYSQGEFQGNHAVDGWPIYGCKNCRHDNWQHNDGKCTIMHNDLNCGKTESTISHYDLGCGKTEETIESATIMFP